LFCLTEVETERGLFETRPDIQIREGDQVVHIIDTKWKRISAGVCDPKRGISQADVYQMMAYAHLYEAPHLTLLFPHHADLPETSDPGEYCIGRCAGWLRVATVNVADGKGILDRVRDLALWDG